MDHAAQSDEPPKPHRRPRYPGTHPRRFEQRYKELAPQDHPDMQAHIRAQGRTPAGTHVPVLLEEVLTALGPAPGEVLADCTLGHGGHAAALLEHVRPGGRLVGLDIDELELARTARRLVAHGAVSTHACNFAALAKVLRAERLNGFDIIFADLGLSSMQVDDAQRGFSYKHDGPLDMRMDRRRVSAAELLESLTEAELAAALHDLADEPDHARIARAIVEQRARQPLRRTGDLVQVILESQGLSATSTRRAAPAGRHQPHPAAQTFQALRILVNDELACLAQFLREAPYCLLPAGRLGVISYHSGEDRLVKHAFRDGLRSGLFEAVSTRPVRPTPAEIHSNPRSAPAKFRWARRANQQL